jgi:hypothetical protein
VTENTRVASDVGADGRAEELRRRIRELEAADEADFGSFGHSDWWLCIVGGVVLPLVAALWFAR